MALNDYRFLTYWRVEGQIDHVYEILGDPLGYPSWWSAIRSAIEVLEPNVEHGANKFTRMELRGWIPYALRWELINSELHKPNRIVSESRGDFIGHGIWSLNQEGPYVDITFDWSVRAQKWFFRYFSLIFKPLFIANHDWVMEQGRKGLIRELAKFNVKGSFQPVHV